MSYAFESAASTATQPGIAERLSASLRSALRAIGHDLAGAWRYAIARREFNRLDESTLRDLGISRGEFDSYWAETEGLAEPTRLRVTRCKRGSGW
jgi:uncharacterized protein YjiS (DUF1127 family)